MEIITVDWYKSTTFGDKLGRKSRCEIQNIVDRERSTIRRQRMCGLINRDSYSTSKRDFHDAVHTASDFERLIGTVCIV